MTDNVQLPEFATEEDIAIQSSDIENRVGGPPVISNPNIDPGVARDIGTQFIIYENNQKIVFEDGYADPTVNIDHERETTDKTTVTGHTSELRDVENNVEFMVQALGRRPPNIEITGWIHADQLVAADEMVSANVVGLICPRYIGYVVPYRVEIPYSRVFDEEHGWIFETTFEMHGVDWSGLPLSHRDADPTQDVLQNELAENPTDTDE